nr:hypothetical protein Iba_chr04bCG10330 [Ipomoea batatas]
MDFFAEPAEEGMEFMNHDADSDDLRSHLNSRAGLNRDVEDPAEDPVNIIHEVPVYPHVATPVRLVGFPESRSDPRVESIEALNAAPKSLTPGSGPIADGPCDLGSTIKVKGDRSAQCELEDPGSGTASTPAELEELAYGFRPVSETSSGMISSIEARHRPQHVHGKERRQGSHSLSSSPWSQPPPSRPPRLYAPKRRSAPLDLRSLSPSQLTIASEDRLLASPEIVCAPDPAPWSGSFQISLRFAFPPRGVRRELRGARAFLPLRRGDDLRVGRRDSFLPFPPERARHLQVGPRSFGRCDYRRSRGHVGTPGCSEGINDRFKAAESDLLPDPLGTRLCRKAFVQNHSCAKEYQHVKG